MVCVVCKTMKIITAILIFFITYSFCNADKHGNITINRKPISLIAIDPGFGGAEKGPSGCNNQAFAKDINLAISNRIAKKIENDLGLDVFLTRETDKFVSLEERVDIANVKNADLLISIHVNGYSDQNVYGIETYCLNIITDDDAIKTAITENTSSRENMQDMDIILSGLMQNSQVEESGLIAKIVHNSLISVLSAKYEKIKDRGVKNAPFYILLGASMPAIIVQPAFITNKSECERLLTDEYQETISSGIVKGIRQYIKGRMK